MGILFAAFPGLGVGTGWGDRSNFKIPKTNFTENLWALYLDRNCRGCSLRYLPKGKCAFPWFSGINSNYGRCINHRRRDSICHFDSGAVAFNRPHAFPRKNKLFALPLALASAGDSHCDCQSSFNAVAALLPGSGCNLSSRHNSEIYRRSVSTRPLYWCAASLEFSHITLTSRCCGRRRVICKHQCYCQCPTGQKHGH